MTTGELSPYHHLWLVDAPETTIVTQDALRENTVAITVSPHFPSDAESASRILNCETVRILALDVDRNGRDVILRTKASLGLLESLIWYGETPNDELPSDRSSHYVATLSSIFQAAPNLSSLLVYQRGSTAVYKSHLSDLIRNLCSEGCPVNCLTYVSLQVWSSDEGNWATIGFEDIAMLSQKNPVIRALRIDISAMDTNSLVGLFSPVKHLRHLFIAYANYRNDRASKESIEAQLQQLAEVLPDLVDVRIKAWDAPVLGAPQSASYFLFRIDRAAGVARVEDVTESDTYEATSFYHEAYDIRKNLMVQQVPHK